MKFALIFAVFFVFSSVLASPFPEPGLGQKIKDGIGHLKDKIGKREVNLEEFYEEPVEHQLQKRGTPFGPIIKGANVVRDGINKIHEKLGTGREYKGKREVNLEEYYEEPVEHQLQKRGTPFGPIIKGAKVVRDGINKIHEKLGTGREYKGKREVNPEEASAVELERHEINKREASVKDKAKDAGLFLACRTPYYLANPGKCRKYDLF